MYPFTAFIALSLVFSVAALVVPRTTPQVEWQSDLLESYDTYHVRYMALGCNLKHNTSFFDQCCHPLLASQTLAGVRPAQCIPPSDNSNDDDCDGNATTQMPSSMVTEPATPTPTATLVATPEPKKVTPPQQPATSRNSAVEVFTDGFATFFYQNGVPGACGDVHSDDDMIAAIDADRYGNTGVKSDLCGQRVSITNKANGNTVDVTIVDACPSCNNRDSIDLSVAAFQQLAPLSQGLLDITWFFD